MERISGTTVATDLFGAGKHGFSGGDAEAMVPATIVSAAWLNALQEEIANAIESTGATLDPATRNQLAQAISLSRIRDASQVFTGSNRFDQSILLGPAAEVVYVNAAGVPTGRLRKERVPVTGWSHEPILAEGWAPSWRFQPYDDPGGFKAGWIKHANYDLGLFRELDWIPNGAVLTKAHAVVEGVSGGVLGAATARVQVGLGGVPSPGGTYAITWGTAAETSPGLNGSWNLDLTQATHWPWMGAINHSAMHRFVIRATGIGAVALRYVDIEYYVPGPGT